jgi:hypothetical protein
MSPKDSLNNILRKIRGEKSAGLENKVAEPITLSYNKQQICQTWNSGINQLTNGLNYRENRKILTNLLNEYSCKCDLSEAQLNTALKRCSDIGMYESTKNMVLNGNTALETLLRNLGNTLEKPSDEIKDILKAGAMIEGAYYCSEIAKGHMEYKNRVERLVTLGFPREDADKAFAGSPDYGHVPKHAPVSPTYVYAALKAARERATDSKVSL